MPGEISAVHGGNIFGFERVKIARVIPVVEVSTEQFHLVHRRQSRFEALDRFQCAQSIRSLARKAWREDRARYLWAMFDVRQRAWAFPENCREGARGPHEKQKFQKNAKSGAQFRRKACASAGDRGLAPQDCGKRLIQSATAGAAAQRTRNGTAAIQARVMSHKPEPQAARRPPEPHRPCAYRSREILESVENLDCAAVTHSSKFLCVINRRPSVRRIASVISHAWYARNVKSQADL